MITKITSREIVYIYGYIEPKRRLTSLLLKEIKHINDIPANPIFDTNIILEHIIDSIDISILDSITNHTLIRHD